MPRYKYIDTQPKLVPVDLARQFLPGTFEHAVNHLLDHAIDLSSFDARFRNDETGAPAFPPGMLLKVVLAAYAHGVVSSRGIERLCQEHMTFIALCGDQPPHFTTIAEFVSTCGDDIARVFAAVVAICDREGLIGREMFAIDGVKLPSNASKRSSGTRADFERQATKLEATAQVILTRHPEDRRGPKGTLRQSNRTDNESAKMATGKGVIQGYTGAAAVDAKHQIVVESQAYGTGSEQEVLLPMVDGMRAQQVLGAESLITADAGYHSEANLRALEERHVEALIADAELRQRDCVPCAHRPRCLRTPETTTVRNVAFFHRRIAPSPARAATATQRMKARIDTAEGRRRYAARFGAVEPVFGNLCANKGLRRFTLRGRAKVDGQWKLFCLVHNIEKLARLRFAA